jgi:hypothetical protein
MFGLRAERRRTDGLDGVHRRPLVGAIARNSLGIRSRDAALGNALTIHFARAFRCDLVAVKLASEPPNSCSGEPVRWREMPDQAAKIARAR